MLINEDYPFALIKFLDKNFDNRIKGMSAEPNILFRLDSVGFSK